MTEKNQTKNCFKNVQVKSSISEKSIIEVHLKCLCVKNTDIHLPDTLQNAQVQFNFSTFTDLIRYAFFGFKVRHETKLVVCNKCVCFSFKLVLSFNHCNTYSISSQSKVKKCGHSK